jgi:hypothetical protein
MRRKNWTGSWYVPIPIPYLSHFGHAEELGSHPLDGVGFGPLAMTMANSPKKNRSVKIKTRRPTLQTENPPRMRFLVTGNLPAAQQSIHLQI